MILTFLFIQDASGNSDTAPAASKQGLKTAPNPASLPTPFLDIWNSLIQQHQQIPGSVPKTVNGQTVSSSKGPVEERTSKPKASSVPSAPKLPSLQVIFFYSILYRNQVIKIKFNKDETFY